MIFGIKHSILTQDTITNDETHDTQPNMAGIFTNQSQAFIGDTLTEQKQPSTTRCYFQNLNGIRWNKEGGDWPAISETMAAIHADIICCAELNQDVNQPKIRGKIESINSRYFKSSRYIASTSKWHPERTYKPGGTAIMVVENTTTLIQRTSRDRMGRWASVRLQGTNNIGITIISAYQVCQKTITGRNTAVNQQISQLIEEAIQERNTTRINPREAFIRDLHQFICQQQQNGDKILLLGDFNDDITNKDSGMAHLTTECGLIDVFALRLENPHHPSTCQRGTKRIDFVLASPSLIPSIKAAGYEPFGYRLTSDHRGLFIDLNTKAVFGNKPSTIAPIPKRDFESNTPGTIPRYITSVIKELKAHNFTKRLQALTQLKEPNHHLAEKLDRDLERAAKYAAKKCKRKYKTAWSPAFSNAWTHLRYWKLHLSKIRNPHQDLQAAIDKWRELHPNLPTINNPTEAQIKQGYSSALIMLRNARQQATQLRVEYLEEKAKMYEEMEKQGKARIITRIKQAEAIKRTYQQIRAIAKETTKGGVTHLKVPADPSSDPKTCNPAEEHWRTERIPKEIERLLIERNQQHFGQAENTPFITDGIQSQIKYNGTGRIAELILKGEYDEPTLTEATRLFIQHLQQRTDATLQGNITSKELMDKLKRWPEKTSTSPSGLHLGHYQVLRRHHGLTKDDPNRKEVETGQKFLIEARVALLNYALTFGYNYKRWTQVVNVMLQKDPGNPKIHRLRVIHLYEADYNLLLAVKWREAMHHAEDNGLLNDGLYGSRPGRSAHEPVLIEVLQNEIYRSSMKSGINLDLDATSCYDRILASIATIASRRMGMAKHVVIVNATTLRDAQFRLKTSLGISDQWYQHCKEFPIHGTGQGSGNSPQIWCFICSVLFDALAHSTTGATFISHDGKMSLTIHMIGFVDDCTQRVNDFQAETQPTAAQLCERMQTEAQKWNDLLWNSGGALEIPKCSFHVIESDWNPNGKPFLKGGTQPNKIMITNDQVPFQVQHRSNYCSHRTLGCHVNPANTMVAQRKALQTKSDAAAAILTTHILSQSDTKVYYNSYYLPSITYPFPVTSLTEEECINIQNKFMQTIVRKCGYNTHMKLEIRYAPTSYGGAGFRPLYVEQGIAQILTAIKHLRTPSGQPGKLLHIALSWAQAYIGTSRFIWLAPHQTIPNHPASWIESIRIFLKKINGSIQLEENNNIVPKKLRERDVFIMDIAMQQSYSTGTIERINACRRYLQAITLADITDATGARLLPGVTQGTIESPKATMTAERFNQQKPQPSAWKTWRKFLKTITTTKGRLKIPLQRWIVKHEDCRKRPRFIHDPGKDILYKHHQEDQYCPLQYDQAGRYYTALEARPTTTQAEGYPVHALDLGNKFRPIYNYKQHKQPKNKNTITFEDYITELPQWERTLLSTMELHKDPATIMTLLNAGEPYVGTDGSVINQAGSYGYVGKSHDHVSLFRGRGPAAGTNMTSFRAEAYGALAVYRFLLRLSEYTEIPLRTNIKHYIDNRSVVKRIRAAQTQKYNAPNRTLAPDWDVVHMATQSIQEMPVQITILWIKSHQDRNTLRNTLSRPAQVNCEADDQAGQYQQEAGSHIPLTPILPTTIAQLQIQEESVNSNYKSRIREAATIPQLQKYYQTKFRWKAETHKLVDWNTYRQIIRPYRKQQTTLVKHLHHIAPTGHIAHRNNNHHASRCPSCPQDPETNNHVLQCRAQSRQKWRETTSTRLQSYLSTTLTSDPILCDILRDGLQRWHNNLPPIETHQYPNSYSLLIKSQNEIGWDHLYRARWSKQWSINHQQFAIRKGLTTEHTEGTTWVRRVGRQILKNWFELWKLRNTERHGQDAETQLIQRKTIINSQIAELYSYRNATMPSDQGMFCATLEDHHKCYTTPEQNEEWMTLWQSTIKASIKQAQTIRQRYRSRKEATQTEEPQ